ncbi:MAG: cation transporter [Desulfurococcaceae archaeon]
MERGIVGRLRGAYRGFMYSAALSGAGLLVELVFYAIWGSIILFTDMIHWLTDTIMEIFALVAMYYAVRVGRRFQWGVLVLEGSTMLLSIAVALAIYAAALWNYVSTSYAAGVVSTTSYASAVGAGVGGALTAMTFLIQRRNYRKYGLEVLRVDYVHALVDTFASAVATAGIVAVAYTRSPGIEVLMVMATMMFAMHSLVEVLKDVVRTVSGSDVDHEMGFRVFRRLVEEFPGVRVEDVVARRIGSFYAVEVRVEVDPDTRLSAAYRLRNRIARAVREESNMIYHVDVLVRPALERARRAARWQVSERGP